MIIWYEISMDLFISLDSKKKKKIVMKIELWRSFLEDSVGSGTALYTVYSASMNWLAWLFPYDWLEICDRFIQR